MSPNALRLASPVKKLSLRIPVFGFKAFFLAVGSLWLLGLLAGYLAQVSLSLEAPAWLAAGLRLLTYVCSALAALLVLYRLWGLAVRFGLFLWALVSKTETVEISATEGQLQEAENDPLTVKMDQAIERIELDVESYLATVETENRESRALLADIQTCGLSLVEIAEQFALRAEQYMARKTVLEEARAAIKAVIEGQVSDLDLVREYAGQVDDALIAQMLLSQAREAGHWRAIREHLSVEVGLLTQFEQANRTYGHKLINQVSKLRKRAAAAESDLQYRESRRPLLMSLKHLEAVANTLRVQLRPGQAIAAAELPLALPGRRAPANSLAALK